MRRIWHPFWAWEDIGMWRDVSNDEQNIFLMLAIEFTGNAEAYGAAMLRVLDEFPIACEHNLTSNATNHQAWIGHAAAFLQHQIPEYLTREAWATLTEQQRTDANIKADQAINEWGARRAAENSRVHQQVGVARLPGRDAGRSAEAT